MLLLDNTIPLDLWLEKGLPSGLNKVQQDVISFTIEHAMLRVWNSWGTIPQVTFARGVGVFAALCANEAFDILYFYLFYFIFLMELRY